MEYTGERLIPGRKGLELLELEHRARYELAVPSARDKAVLDLGCGTGYGTARLAEVAARAVGIDLSPEAIAYARGAYSRANLSFEECDVTDDALIETVGSLHPEPFDLIVCFEVLEHLAQPTEFLSRIKRLLHPSGLLFLSTPNIDRPHAAIERDNPFHVVEYGEGELSAVFAERFSSVVLLRQSVHLASRIGTAEEDGLRRESWRESSPAEAKYFVAVCADRPVEEVAAEGLLVSTSDAHLMLLQDRLAELRKDQHQRGRTIERLRARIDALEQDLQMRDLLHRQEQIVSELARETAGSSRESLQAAIRILGDDEPRPEDATTALERLVDLAGRLRRERDAALSDSERAREEKVSLQKKLRGERATLDKQHREELAALEGLLGEERKRGRAIEQRLQDLDRRIGQADEERRELLRQVDERTAAGIELAQKLEEQAEDLAARTEEVRAGRAHAQELEETVRRLESRLREVPPPVADPSFVRFFADLSARTDEKVGRLLRRNAELENQSVRLIQEIESERGAGAVQAVEAPATVDDLHRDLQTWRSLARDLAIELHHVLTSRRWRFAMLLVRLRNFLLRIQEGNPIAGHLYYHLRRAGQEPTSFDFETADARAIRRRFAWRPLARTSSRMKLLSDRERDEAARALLAQEAGREPLVSVVMPTWNRADQIGEAIQSVQEQSYRSWELLVVDDGSTDSTAELVARFSAADPRIHHVSIPHRGVSAARDTGLQAAKGELIAYLDSDNRWHPHYLLFMVNAIRSSGRQCAYSALRVIDHDRGEETSLRRRRFDYGALLKNNYIDINVFMHKAELFRRLGGFDHELRRWVDWDLILRYVRRYPPEEVPIVLCDYNRAKRSRQITLEEPASFKFKVLNKHLIDWEGQRRGLPHRIPGMVSVVIPNFNLPEMTARCVESILAAGGPELEVVVVDNGSDPRKRRKLRQMLPESAAVQVLETYENYGFALGCNLGAAASRGEIVVWLNNDTEVHPGWLAPLTQPLHEDPRVGIVGPKLLWPDGTLQHGGMVFGPRSKIPYHVYQGYPGDHPAVNKRRRFQALSGACYAVRADDVVALQGFDPVFLNGCEDLDFCFRMRTVLHKQVLYEPASMVVHYEGKTPGRSKNIQFNRRTFVARWGEQVRADDAGYFAEDGFSVQGYVKKGAEKDGETALYHPRMEARAAAGEGEVPNREARTLRVGLVSIWYERGVSYVTRQFAVALEKHGGYETHVFARWESDRFHNAGSNFHPRVVNAGDDPSPQETVGWARDRRLDLVVFVEIHPNDWKRVRALRREGVKVLCYEHLDILRMDMLERYGDVDGFVANSFHTWEVWRREVPGKPALVVPWGIAPDLVRANLDRAPSSELRFLHIAGWGGLNGRKNTSLCIEAFDEAAPPGARLSVYSQSPLEKYGEACVDIVRRNRAIDVHVGTVDDIWKIYRNADVLLWPSKREGLGLPILEALASGIPALISDGWLMKEWPVIGEHALLCRVREGVVGEEAVRRYLPLVEVDRDDLVRRIRELAEERSLVASLTANVLRDRSRWLWTWQTVSLGMEIRRFIETGEFHPDPASYVPSYMLEFERRRAESRGEAPTAIGRDRSAGAAVPASGSGQGTEFLFIAGCQRSGTTALLHLLNEDERIVMGRERFKFCRREITPRTFREERFFSPGPKETNYRDEDFYGRLHARWRSGTVRYIGDKVPFYYKDLFYLAESFPTCKILFLIRDLEAVAASYNARAANPKDKVWKPSMDYRQAVEDWNESLERLVEFVEAGHQDRVFVVPYERFFCGDEASLEALYRFLELPVTEDVRAAFRSLTEGWDARIARPSPLTPEMVEHLAARRDRVLENRCLEVGAAHGDRAAVTGVS